MRFRDREEAGRLLAERLASYTDRDVVVLAIPRGAVVIGAVVAKALGAPLDVVLVRKIGAPGNPEFAAGAVDQDGGIIGNPVAGVTREYLESEGARERETIERRIQAYRGGVREPEVEGRTAIVVDDGVATGLTARKAVSFLRSRGAASVVLAVPVIAPEAAEVLGREADEVIALSVPDVFWAVGSFYSRFPQVSDDEVVRILSAFRARGAASA